MADIDDYPGTLKGGYYDGARLVGTLDGGDAVEYYNPTSHAVLEYEYNEAESRLDAGADPERPLGDRSLAEHVRRARRHRGGYDALSAWVRERVDDDS